jgi:hypothetical protein
MSDKEDLWPHDLLDAIPTSPRDILQQQAALLGPKTKNIVLADVAANVLDDGTSSLQFYLRVPALSGYKFDLFTLQHGIDLYPVTDMDSGLELNDEDRLKSFVQAQPGSRETIKIVRALVSQARNIDHDEVPF